MRRSWPGDEEREFRQKEQHGQWIGEREVPDSEGNRLVSIHYEAMGERDELKYLSRDQIMDGFLL